MSLRDIDLNVRINALNLIADLDKTGIFDEDPSQRPKITRLVYDSEPKIRKAVSGFFHGLWEQRVQDLKSAWSGGRKKKGKAPKEDEMEIRFGYKAIAILLLETARMLDPTNSDLARASSRATAAVEALWDQFEELQNWEELAEYLLLDHSEEDSWLLEEDEETLLLSIFVACIKRDDTVSCVAL
jgi:cohesin complex subunit SA-1/2